MDYIRDRKSNISFSLHDSRILQIEINEDKLSLNMDRIFQYTDNEEKWYKGIIEFTNIDKEECNIMVFNAATHRTGIVHNKNNIRIGTSGFHHIFTLNRQVDCVVSIFIRA